MEKFEINNIIDYKDIIKIIEMCMERYGSLIVFSLTDKKGFLKNYWDIPSFENDEEKYLISNITKISVTLVDNEKETLAIIDPAKKEIIIKPIEIETKTEVLDIETDDIDIKSYLIPNDDNLEFYLFDDKVLVKFSKNENLYYTYNRKDNTWKEDTSLISQWFYGTEHYFKKIEKRRSK